MTRLGATALLTAALMSPFGRAHASSPTPVVLLGKRLDTSPNPTSTAIAIATRRLSQPFVLRTERGRTLHLSANQLGIRLDKERLIGVVNAALDPTSSLSRQWQQKQPGKPVKLELPIEIDAQRTWKLLLELKEEIDRRPVEARIDPLAKTARAQRKGIALNVPATLEKIKAAIARGDDDATAAIVRYEPKRTGENLDASAFTERLGYFDTSYNGLERDRTFNLRVAAKKLDGLVVMPGDTFDFNDVVGERSEINGFRVAPVIAAGELVDGMGGGTCQISGTLHAAVFFAGLEILERTPHSRPSAYIKLGLDAAVSYPNLNFRFRNDLDSPVVITLRVEGGRTKATVWGKKRTRRVRFTRTIEEISPFAESIEQDPSLPLGTRVLAQRGVPGFRVRRRRVVTDLAKSHGYREVGEDVYPPTLQIWRVGTAEAIPPDFELPKDDTHGEYRADEYLVMTQGPAVLGTREQREPGISGRKGWIEREGLLQGSTDGE